MAARQQAASWAATQPPAINAERVGTLAPAQAAAEAAAEPHSLGSFLAEELSRPASAPRSPLDDEPVSKPEPLGELPPERKSRRESPEFGHKTMAGVSTIVVIVCVLAARLIFPTAIHSALQAVFAPEGSGGKYEANLKEMMSLGREKLDLLKGIHDRESAGTNIPRIDQIDSRVQTLKAEIDHVQRNDGQFRTFAEEAAAERLVPQLDELGKQVMSEIARVRSQAAQWNMSDAMSRAAQGNFAGPAGTPQPNGQQPGVPQPPADPEQPPGIGNRGPKGNFPARNRPAHGPTIPRHRPGDGNPQ